MDLVSYPIYQQTTSRLFPGNEHSEYMCDQRSTLACGGDLWTPICADSTTIVLADNT